MCLCVAAALLLLLTPSSPPPPISMSTLSSSLVTHSCVDMCKATTAHTHRGQIANEQTHNTCIKHGCLDEVEYFPEFLSFWIVYEAAANGPDMLAIGKLIFVHARTRNNNEILFNWIKYWLLHLKWDFSAESVSLMLLIAFCYTRWQWHCHWHSRATRMKTFKPPALMFKAKNHKTQIDSKPVLFIVNLSQNDGCIWRWLCVQWGFVYLLDALCTLESTASDRKSTVKKSTKNQQCQRWLVNRSIPFDFRPRIYELNRSNQKCVLFSKAI